MFTYFAFGFRCCVKVEVAILGSPSLTSLIVSVDMRTTLKRNVLSSLRRWRDLFAAVVLHNT